MSDFRLQLNKKFQQCFTGEESNAITNETNLNDENANIQSETSVNAELGATKKRKLKSDFKYKCPADEEVVLLDIF